MKVAKNLIKIFLAPACVLVFHILVTIIFNIYNRFPWFDIPMHFLGGFSIAISSLIFLREMQKSKHLGKMNPWVKFLFVISLVALIAVLWEFFEFMLDHSFSGSFQGGLPDTMLDLLMGLIGGTAGFLIFSKN